MQGYKAYDIVHYGGFGNAASDPAGLPAYLKNLLGKESANTGAENALRSLNDVQLHQRLAATMLQSEHPDLFSKIGASAPPAPAQGAGPGPGPKKMSLAEALDKADVVITDTTFSGGREVTSKENSLFLSKMDQVDVLYVPSGGTVDNDSLKQTLQSMSLEVKNLYVATDDSLPDTMLDNIKPTAVAPDNLNAAGEFVKSVTYPLLQT